MKKDLPTYVIHYTKYEQRKKVLEKILEKEGFENVNYIVEFDREKIGYEEYFNSFKADYVEWHRRNHPNFSPNCYPLTPGEVSFTLKQKYFLYKFVESEYSMAFLLEDDVILNENFIQQFDKYVESLPKDFDVAFFGQGAGLRVKPELIQTDVYWYAKDYPAARCGDSFLITKEMAKKLLTYMHNYKIAFPIDQEYSFWFRELQAKVYWLEPPITVQGSQIGLYTSVQQEYNTNCHFEDKTMYVRKDLQKILNEV